MRRVLELPALGGAADRCDRARHDHAANPRGSVERPEINAPLHLGGRRIVPDYLWRDRRLAIEADSRRWHDDPSTRRNDADKQAILEANGYRVLRITDDQVADEPQQTLARVRAALQSDTTTSA